MPPQELSSQNTSPAQERASGPAGERGGDLASLAPWGLLVLALVVLGLLLSARAGDEYMAVAGILFAVFGAFLGFRLLGRALP